jgi:hypothetical protein
MMEEGTLSIVRRGHTYQVRYASNNPYTMDHELSTHPDEGHVSAWLHHCGLDPWAIQQAAAELRHGRMAVLPVVWSPAQRHASFLVPGASAQADETNARPADQNLGNLLEQHNRRASYESSTAATQLNKERR